MNIPMVDLQQQYQSLRSEINEAVSSVLESAHYILGPNVEALATETAEYCGVEHAIPVASGTDALHLALLACNIKPGDEVVFMGAQGDEIITADTIALWNETISYEVFCSMGRANQKGYGP